MLKAASLATIPASRSFLELWIKRYRLDALPIISTCTGGALKAAIDKDGRRQTARKALRSLRASSELAALKTNGLFTYLPNMVDLSEVRQIAVFVEKIYAKILELYQQQTISPAWLALIDTLDHSNNVLEIWQQASTIPLLSIEQLSSEVEPLILELQEQHLRCKDRRTIGFMSTQFHFSTEVLLSRLDPIEQLLLKPYLTFVEEQVCIPWQRICVASSQYSVDSPVLLAVKSMLSRSKDIEDATYRRAIARFPNHRSRRGLLTRPEVAASSTRDINMFQAYLGLCALEDSLSSLEDELLPLCMMVFPSISVDWTLVEAGVDYIAEAIYQHLDAHQIPLLKPYIIGMQSMFTNARSHPLFLDISRQAS